DAQLEDAEQRRQEQRERQCELDERLAALEGAADGPPRRRPERRLQGARDHSVTRRVAERTTVSVFGRPAYRLTVRNCLPATTITLTTRCVPAEGQLVATGAVQLFGVGEVPEVVRPSEETQAHSRDAPAITPGMFTALTAVATIADVFPLCP